MTEEPTVQAPPPLGYLLHTASETTAALAEALAESQGALKQPHRDRTVTVRTKTGGEYTYGYATLTAVIDAVREACAPRGLSFTQAITAKGPHVGCTTRLMHSSGEWIESPVLRLTAAEDTPQAVGSACTYARRYSLSALFGISADEDDDAAAAESPEHRGTRETREREPRRAAAPDARTRPSPPAGPNGGGTPPPSGRGKKAISAKQQAWLEREMKKSGVEAADLATFMRDELELAVTDWADIPMSAFDEVMAFVRGEYAGGTDSAPVADDDPPF